MKSKRITVVSVVPIVAAAILLGAGVASKFGLTSPSKSWMGTEVLAQGQGSELELRVMANPGSLDIIPSPTFAGQGPFYIPGQILDPQTGGNIGVFHCWGFFVQGGAIAVVSQEFDLFGLGKIQVQGVEDEGPRAVTGGTGRFSNVRGEMTGADLSAFPDFTVTFKLVGAGGGR